MGKPRDHNLGDQLVALFDGSDEEQNRLETLADCLQASVLIQHSNLDGILELNETLNSIDVVIVSLTSHSQWRNRLSSIERLKDHIPIIVMCAAFDHLRALQGVRCGARDWLVYGETDAQTFDGILQRVIAEQQALSQLKNSLKLYRSVADDQFDLICRFCPDGTLTFVNRAYANYFDSSVDALQGESFLCNVPDEDHDRVLAQIKALTPTAPAISFDHHEYVDGHIIWMQWTDSAVFGSDGQVVEYQSVGRDVTVRRNAEQAANDNEARYRTLYENAPVMMHVVGIEGLLQSVNRCWLEMLGYVESDVIGASSINFLTEESQILAKAKMKRILQGEDIREVAMKFRHAQGRLLDVLVTATAMRDAAGEILGIVMVGVEHTERIQALRELEKEKERLRTTLASIGDAVITTDHTNHVDYLNPTAETLTGWTRSEAYGCNLNEVFHLVDSNSAMSETADLTKHEISTEPVSARLFNRRLEEGAIVEFTIAPIQAADGGSFGHVLVFRDTTEAQALADRMSYQANHDPLTGLLNRRAFEEQLQQGIESNEQGTAHVLCFLDLDRFKLVNDSCGHEAGDRVLCKLSEIIQSRLRPTDTLSRLGGDEFAVLLSHCSKTTARDICDSIRADVAAYRFASQEHVFSFGVSIGMVLLSSECTVSSALRAADNACYTAKAAGKNRVHFYEGEDGASIHQDDDSIWAQRVTEALDENRFTLLSQVIERAVPDFGSGVCFEVLVRMRDDKDKMIPPIAFIPAAERFGLMSQVDRWVIENVFEWLVAHSDDLDKLQHCAINLSGRSLDESGFLAFVESKFDSTGVPASKVCFEITETAAIASLDAALRFMDVLKKRGCKFSLDDFGSGLSSFAYLKSLPVDYLKIDGVFVRDILDDETGLAMVRAINDIAQVLGKRTVAEYVENDSIRAVLVDLGVDWVQGYGVGKPIPIETLWDQSLSSIHGSHPSRAA